MKNIAFFSIMVYTTFLLLTSCETASDPITKKYIPDNEQIAYREPPDNCTDCPNGCCCCTIILLDPISNVNLSICGVCEGDYLCGTFNPPAPCSSVSGQGYDIGFTSVIVRRQFCVPEGGSFRITNNHGFPVTITFTCQHDVLDPDTHNITIPANGGSVNFVSDGECFLAGPCI